MKIVLNKSYGGFGLSEKALARYIDKKGIICWKTVHEDQVVYANDQGEIWDWEIERTDPALVSVVEEMGADSWGHYAELVVVDIPPGTKYIIDEYDGLERIRTPDSYDWKISTGEASLEDIGYLVEPYHIRKLREVSRALNDANQSMTWDARRDLANLTDLIISQIISNKVTP